MGRYSIVSVVGKGVFKVDVDSIKRIGYPDYTAMVRPLHPSFGAFLPRDF
jgi:hypothetical protein